MAPLPFDKTADVLLQGGTVATAGIAVSTPWKQSQSPGRVGVEHTHTAQAEIEASGALQGTNRKLRVEGDATYAIVSAIPNEFLPHVELELRRVSGS